MNINNIHYLIIRSWDLEDNTDVMTSMHVYGKETAINIAKDFNFRGGNTATVVWVYDSFGNEVEVDDEEE